MKRKLFFMMLCIVGALNMSAVRTDVTDTYLDNANFASGNPVDNNVCTYGNDMVANNTTYYGAQSIDKWTNASVGETSNGYDSCGIAGALFEYGGIPWLAGTGNVAPDKGPDGNSGNAVGLCSVWGCTIRYTQDVTLPAGSYTVKFDVYNATTQFGSGKIIKSNFFGFAAEDGTTYYAPNNTFAIGQWSTIAVTFNLTKNTKGVISMGYVGSSGSANMPHLFVDNVKILKNDFYVDKSSAVNPTGWTRPYQDDGNQGTAFNRSDGISVQMQATYGNSSVGRQIYQTISGLDNGTYEAVVYAYSQQEWGGAGASLQNDAGNVGYVFAEGGLLVKEWINARRGPGYPADGPGKYTISNIIVTDGTLTLGFAIDKERQTEWHAIQVQSLIYVGGVDIADYQKALAEKVALASSYKNNIPASIYELINNVVVENNKQYSTIIEYSNAIQNIQNAIDTYISDDLIKAYAEYRNLYATANNYLSQDVYFNSEDAIEVLRTSIEEIDNQMNENPSIENIKQHTLRFYSLIKTFISQVNLKRGACLDITCLISNPGMDDVDGWQGDIPTIKWYEVPMSNAEFFNINFNIYQTIYDMPKGNYALKVQAFQRPGSNDVAYNNFMAGQQNINSFIYINDGQTTIKNVMSEYSTTALLPVSTIGGNNWPDYAWPNGAGYTPNGMEGAQLYFDLGYYENEVFANIEAGELTFGLKCESHVDDAWTLFDNFRLYYYGSAIDLTLDENENMRLISDIENANVTLKLDVKAGELNALVLPFDIDMGTFIDIAGNGSQIFSLVNQYDDALIFAPDSMIKANVPFLLRSTNNVSTWLFDGCYIYKNDEPKLEGTIFDFMGNYTSGIVIPSGNYVINNTVFEKSSYDMTIKSFHAYFKPVSSSIANDIVFVTNGLDPKRIDVEDLNVLKRFYNNCNGDNWSNVWNLEANPVTVRNLPGIIVKDGKVIDINLSGSGISGPFPFDLFDLNSVERINVSGNSLNGVINDSNNNTSSSLIYLNISDNQLSGNISKLAALAPSLQTLIASNNKFTDVTPAISSLVSNLDIKTQNMDKTYEVNLSDFSEDALFSSLPSILFYNHENQTYSTDLNLSCISGTDFKCSIVNSDDNLNINLLSTNNVYRGDNNDLLDVTSTDGNTFRIHLSYPSGDANFNGYFDVTDLMTTIKFIFDEYKVKPFNFIAANLYNDIRINVQDVVMIVDELLSLNNEGNNRPARIRERLNKYTEDAVIEWRGNELVLTSSIPLTAVDLIVENNTNITWLFQNLGLSYKCVAEDNRFHVVAYSMNGTEIPVGSTVIATADQPGNVVNMVLSDKEAQQVLVKILNNDNITGIHNIENINDETEIYDISGRRVASDRLYPGIYVINGKKIVIR